MKAQARKRKATCLGKAEDLECVWMTQVVAKVVLEVLEVR